MIRMSHDPRSKNIGSRRPRRPSSSTTATTATTTTRIKTMDPIQMETPTPDSPSSDWHLINRYPELQPEFAQRVVEVEVPTDHFLTAEQAIDLGMRLIRHGTVLKVGTPEGP